MRPEPTIVQRAAEIHGTRRRGERGLHAFVQPEQVLDAFTFRREALPAVETIDSTIQRVMRSSEVGRHQVRVVQVRQRRPRMAGTSLKDSLREQLQRRRVRGREAGRQRERVVDQTDGVTVIALQSPADVAQPCHVHGRGEQGEDRLRCVRQGEGRVARNRRRFQPADGHVLPAFRTDPGND